MLVHIDNCNNIKSANIDLQEQKMNIFLEEMEVESLQLLRQLHWFQREKV